MAEPIATKISTLTPSAWVLIGANAVPVLGVLFFGWSAFDVVFLYWLENVMFGVINLMKMATCTSESDTKLGTPFDPGKLFLMPFFTIHYGIFCLVHGIFVFVLLGDGGPFSNGGFFRGSGNPSFGADISGPFDLFSNASSIIWQNQLVWAALFLAASLLFSFFTEYIGKGEYRETNAAELMHKPYGRIVVLHIALLFGAFLIVAFGSPVFLLLILIIGKTSLDLKLHLKEHRQQLNPT